MKTIAVDFDDVLADSARGFVDFCNQKWGTKLTVDDYSEHWAQMWGIDKTEADKRAELLYKSGVQGRFSPLEEAKPVLSDLGKKYELVITTSRVRKIQKDTLDWIDQHYKGVFKEIHFSGLFDTDSPDRHKLTKTDLLKSIRADYLIDDHPKHCVAAAETGIVSLLFGDYAWNRRLDNLPRGVTRVLNWSEVKSFFENERN